MQSDTLNTVAEGDEITVQYQTTRDTPGEKKGTVTSTSSTGVIADTGNERPDSTPILFRVTVGGTVESLTGDTARRISSGVNDRKKTDLTVTPASTRVVSDIEEIKDDGEYRYQYPDDETDDTDRYRFRAEWWDDDSHVTLYYRDGYVSDVPVENLERYISEEKIVYDDADE